jgi:hypothetical protein
MVRCNEAIDAIRYMKYKDLTWTVGGERTDLVFCGLCVEQGKQRITVAIAFCSVCT